MAEVREGDTLAFFGIGVYYDVERISEGVVRFEHGEEIEKAQVLRDLEEGIVQKVDSDE